MANRYWVGNTGYWNDTAHWSTASGGAGGDSIPSPTDDAFFDTNSFSLSNQTVDINPGAGSGAQCNNFTVTASKSAVIINSNVDVEQLYVYGDFFLDGLMKISSNVQVRLEGDSGAASITMNGSVFAGFLTIGLAHAVDAGSTRTWTLQDNLVMLEGTLGGVIQQYTGTFDMNGHDVTVGAFIATNATGLAAACILGPLLRTKVLVSDEFGGGSFNATGNSIIIDNIDINPLFVGLTIGEIALTSSGYTLNNVYLNTNTIFGGRSFTASSVVASPGISITLNHGNTYTWTSFTALGTFSSPITIGIVAGVDSQSTLSCDSINFSYLVVQDIFATGAASPFDDSIGGIDNGNNTNWLFYAPVTRISQNVYLEQGALYRIKYTTVVTGQIKVLLSNYFNTLSNTSVSINDTFTNSSLTGVYILSFTAQNSSTIASLDNVSIKKIVQPAVADNIPVKEFLKGATDEGRDIIFRADTQQIQLQKTFETLSNPIAVVSRIDRGSQMKCFVAIDNDEFYEIQGTENKGVSILKVHSKQKSQISTPPIAHRLRLSFRDSSSQICRLVQTAIIFIPGTMDYSE